MDTVKITLKGLVLVSKASCRCDERERWRKTERKKELPFLRVNKKKKTKKGLQSHNMKIQA